MLGKNIMNTIIKAGSEQNWQQNNLFLSCNFNINCNFQCSYCINKKFRSNFNEQLSQKALYNLFSNLPLLKKDFYSFSIAGGEPSLYQHFPDVLKYMKEFFPPNKIKATWLTNGSLLHKLEEYFKDYRAYDFNLTITLHLEQMNAETYLKKLSEFKYPDMCTIKIMLEPGTLKQIDSIIEKIKNFGYKKFNVMPITINQKLYPNYTTEEIQFLETSSFNYQRLFNEYLRENQTIKKEYTRNEYNLNPELINYKGLKCLAGYNSLIISPDGAISSCYSTMKNSVCNINSDSLINYMAEYEPITCQNPWCACGTYTAIPKWNPKYSEAPNYFIKNFPK